MRLSEIVSSLASWIVSSSSSARAAATAAGAGAAVETAAGAVVTGEEEWDRRIRLAWYLERGGRVKFQRERKPPSQEEEEHQQDDAIRREATSKGIAESLGWINDRGKAGGYLSFQILLEQCCHRTNAWELTQHRLSHSGRSQS
jgi:hypothetical protein